MGIVYKAKQQKLDRLVALKVILMGDLAGKEDIRRFNLEAEAAAQLDHPNIVSVYDVGEVEGRHYMAMALIDGHSLKDRLLGGHIEPREAAALVASIAEAVEYAHQRGIIHRDLKPANVILDTRNQPRITDFGLAKRLDRDSSLTATGQVLGTPNYMAPEQAGGKTDEVGPMADVYALGAILYHLLAGRPPFEAATVVETLQRVMEQEPVSPREINRAVPTDLETICLKCLEKELVCRYSSAGDLASELRRFLRGEPIQARPIPRWEWAWRWIRRTTIGTVFFCLIGIFLLRFLFVNMVLSPLLGATTVQSILETAKGIWNAGMFGATIGVIVALLAFWRRNTTRSQWPKYAIIGAIVGFVMISAVAR